MVRGQKLTEIFNSVTARGKGSSEQNAWRRVIIITARLRLLLLVKIGALWRGFPGLCGFQHSPRVRRDLVGLFSLILGLFSLKTEASRPFFVGSFLCCQGGERDESATP